MIVAQTWKTVTMDLANKSYFHLSMHVCYLHDLIKDVSLCLGITIKGTR